MANVEVVGDANHPVSVLTQTSGGRVVDLSNFPGALKIKMILEGEMGVDAFATPPNMPGAKLRKLREQHRAAMEKVLGKAKMAEKELEASDDDKNLDPDKVAEAAKVDYQVGDHVTFKDEVYEVMKTRSDAVLLSIKYKKGQALTWVPKVKVTKG